MNEAELLDSEDEEGEIELAAELLAVTDEQEFRSVVRRIARRTRRRRPGRATRRKPAWKTWGRFVRGTVRRLLPRIRPFVNPVAPAVIDVQPPDAPDDGADPAPIPDPGAAVDVEPPPEGDAEPDTAAAPDENVAPDASEILGVELEGLSPEDQELEVARRIVRLATVAADGLTTMPAATAIGAAARRHAPGLIPADQQQHQQRRRTMHDLDRTLRTSESESEFTEAGDWRREAGDYESYEGEGEGEYDNEDENDLAAELLTLSEEAELDQFLGKLLRKGGRFAKAFAPLGKMLKPLAKKLLPIAGTAVGTFFGGPAGAALGGKLASVAANAFEIESEGMVPEEMEMEVARRFVRLADDAAQEAAAAPPHADPNAVAKAAIRAAVERNAPGLARTGGGGRRRYGRANSGQWYRRGNVIIVRL